MAYEERFEPGHGPLRAVVPRVVHEYLECGRPEGGFARIRCPSCRGEHLLAFSCQTRNFCPSCQAKRAALFAEKLTAQILAEVPHRHVVFTVPKVVRGLFERERRLLSILPCSAHHSTQAMLREVTGDPEGTIGTVASIQTFGSFAANFHPHVHAISLASAVLTAARAGASSQDLRAEVERAQHEVALLSEELDLKDSRWIRLSPRRQPHYTPVQRMRILQLKAARNWSCEKAAEALLLDEQTLKSFLLDQVGGGARLLKPCPASERGQQELQLNCRSHPSSRSGLSQVPILPLVRVLGHYAQRTMT